MRLRLDKQRIEEFRTLEGLYKHEHELAARAGVHPNQLTRIGADKAVGVRTAKRIATAMGVEVREITTELVEAGAA